MAETANQTPKAAVEQQEAEVTPTRWANFKNNHPRAAKAAVITTVVAAAAGSVHFVRTVLSNKDHLASAADHVREAGNEVLASTSPTDAEA